MDSDGVWNVARVLSVPSLGEVGEICAYYAGYGHQTAVERGGLRFGRLTTG